MAEVTVGTPATLHYWNDSRAAVVTRVSAKSITIARVETGPTTPDMACDPGVSGARPVRAEGILDRVIEGTGQRYSFRDGAWRNGSMRATLGRSVTWIDYRV